MDDEMPKIEGSSASVKRIAMPERCTFLFSTDPAPSDSIPLSIPSSILRPLGFVTLIPFLVMSGVAWPMIAELAHFDASTLFSLIASLFELCWVVIWMIGPLFFGAVTLFFIFHRTSARIQDGALFSVLHLGPVSIRSEYDLDQIRGLSIQPAASDRSGKARLYFEYHGQSHHLGAIASADELKEVYAVIQAEIDRPKTTAARRPTPPGFDIKRFILKQIEKRTMRKNEESGDETEGAEDSGTKTRPAPQALKQVPQQLYPISSAALFLANLVPAAGVLIWDWDLSEVFALYWAENAVIGFFNVLKIAVVGKWMAIFDGLFFIVHYGGFMAVHFLFVYTMFIRGTVSAGPDLPPAEIFASVFGPIWMPLLAIVLSHGISFFTNFLGRKEYKGQNLRKLMSQPYGRIVVLHLTIIFGGWMVLLLHSAKPALLLLVGLKTIIDLRAHWAQRAENGGRAYVTRRTGRRTK